MVFPFPATTVYQKEFFALFDSTRNRIVRLFMHRGYGIVQHHYENDVGIVESASILIATANAVANAVQYS